MPRNCAFIDVFVSIPAGFSDALRLGSDIVCLRKTAMFQSLLGFLMRCDINGTEAASYTVSFQSLLGFLMRCDSLADPTDSQDAAFQSLLGFLMRCDSIRAMIFDLPLFFRFNPCWVF